VGFFDYSDDEPKQIIARRDRVLLRFLSVLAEEGSK
jgi:hypothetical protein